MGSWYQPSEQEQEQENPTPELRLTAMCAMWNKSVKILVGEQASVFDVMRPLGHGLEQQLN